MDFTKTTRNAGVLLAYPLAFAYLKFFAMDFSGDFTVLKRVLFVTGFIILNMLVLRGREKTPSKETFFWYAVMFIVALTSVTGISEVVSVLGLHLCAVYTAVVSCSLLYEGRTGSFIMADLFNAGVFKSFAGFSNLIKDLSGTRKGGAKKTDPVGVAVSVFGVIIMIPIFITAVALLCGINSSFDASVSIFLNSLSEIIGIEFFARNIGYVILAVPVSLYMYGMISSCASSDGEEEKKTYGKLISWRGACRKISEVLASFVTGCFVVLYLIFFSFEGSYLFSAFAGRLPEEFTAAEYARRGFFELTGIMFINMMVFVLVSYFTRREGVAGKISSGMIIALMSESVVFAAVSFSKLALYYSRFGYTPKRLLAIWGTLIFAAGAVMVIISLVRKKDMSRKWILFTTASFALMNVISSVIYFMV